MRFALVLLALCCVAVPGHAEGVKPPGIKGADDRELVESSEWPWSAIGRVNRSIGGSCTGTMIAADRVLTAAHCLWDKRGKRWLPPGYIHFVAGYRRGSYVAHARVAAYQLGSDRPPNGLLKEALDDWAVLTLEEAIGDRTGIVETLPLTVKVWTALRKEGGVLVRAGYSLDKAHILSRHVGCVFTKFWNTEDTVFHDCDATRGDSGSPILVRRGDRYHLIAIHVATATHDGVQTGIAVSGHRFHAKTKQQAKR
jgi:protease YdgD